jgi:hypothetical protein
LKERYKVENDFGTFFLKKPKNAYPALKNEKFKFFFSFLNCIIFFPPETVERTVKS